ncbi:DNA-binding CsgD family transcriptional regulator [Flavobacterium sp. 28YEA47A]|uniref:helix-turn-helix transcriptional regulator n=1 Tax=Flavobacterium sp. 28YEA47A TaxID=3156276 RepID=UPI00351231F6
MVLESISGFYSKLIEIGTEKDTHKMKVEHIKLWNKSFLSLSLLFFAIAVCDLICISSLISYCFFLLSILFFYGIFTDLKFNVLAQTYTYLLLSFIFFYISSHTGLGSGIHFYYIPLILSLPYFLKVSRNKKAIALICFFLFFVVFLDVKTNSVEHPKKDMIFLESLLGSLGLVFWFIYFIIRKQAISIKYYKKRVEMWIREAEIDMDKLKEVIDMAVQNNSHFFPKFKKLYPYFCERLIEIQPNVVASEQEFCAYIKLGFTTKEIAKFTNSSIRSIEGKKYRIRRKYNISEKVDIYIWAANL